jgi:hypothetical protein
MRAIRWTALLCSASLALGACGGSESRSSTPRLRNSAVNCFATEAERNAALANAKSTRDAAVADLASKGDESALSTALSDADLKYESAKSKYEETQGRIESLRQTYFAGIGAGHNQRSSPEYQSWTNVVVELNTRNPEAQSLRTAMVANFQAAQSARGALTNWQSAKNAADQADQQLATTETIPFCEAAESSASSVVEVSSTSSVVDDSGATSVVADSSTTSVVDVSSTTSQPSTDATLPTDSSTTTSSIASVVSDTVSCEISDIAAPSQVAVGDEFEVSARFTGAGCVEGPPNRYLTVRVGMAFSGDLLLLSNGCPAGNCEGVVSYRFRARVSGRSVVYPAFQSGDVNILKEVTIAVVSAQSTTTSTIAEDERAEDEVADSSTSLGASDAASCKYSKPVVPSQVTANEPFDITFDTTSEYCSDRLYVVFTGFDGEVRATAILNEGNRKTITMMILGSGLVNFHASAYDRGITRKVAEFQVASVEPAKRDSVDPCAEPGSDTPDMLGTSKGLQVSTSCDAAEGLNIQIRTRQGDLVFERVTGTKFEIGNDQIDLFLNQYGYVVIAARHLCPGRSICGSFVGVELERSSSDEDSSATTSTTVASVTTLAPASAVAPEVTTTTEATTTVFTPAVVSPTVDSPTGQQASTVIPVGLFGLTTEGDAVTATEVTKIAVDAPAVILICDQTCIENVATQTGADPQDPTAIEVSIDGGAWQPALGSVVPIVNGRATVRFRGTPLSGAAVILGAELFTNDTPLETVNTLDGAGNVTNASGEVVAQVPVYDVVESGFSLDWWMWLLAGLTAFTLLFLLPLFWRKRMSALAEHHSTGDRTEQK